MKNYSLNLFLALILFTTGLVLADINPVNAESRGDMKSLAKQSIIVWNTGNTAIADQIYAPDFKMNWVDQDVPDINGVAELMDYLSFIRKAYPDMQIVADHLNVDGDTVVARITFTGTNMGPRGDMAPTNKKVKISAVWIIQIEEGVITEQFDYNNRASILTQLGYEITPPSQEN
ncbi:MAG: hypothetical protein DHS20C13_20200 [Thermodesulfobacteriota bacterium]|nr:MAG: hypothetical protein DHS20C13_20200 [Thermodesulfobacteriota bacterium]